MSRKRPCPLKGCTNNAYAFTLCKSCADTHQTWIRHTPKSRTRRVAQAQ